MCPSVDFLYQFLSGCGLLYLPCSYFGAGEGIKILSGGSRRLRVFDISPSCFFIRNPDFKFKKQISVSKIRFQFQEADFSFNKLISVS